MSDSRPNSSCFHCEYNIGHACSNKSRLADITIFKEGTILYGYSIRHLDLVLPNGCENYKYSEVRSIENQKIEDRIFEKNKRDNILRFQWNIHSHSIDFDLLELQLHSLYKDTKIKI